MMGSRSFMVPTLPIHLIDLQNSQHTDSAAPTKLAGYRSAKADSTKLAILFAYKNESSKAADASVHQ